VLEGVHPGRVVEFADKVDNDWANLLWPYRGDDFIVDDKFLRYFEFVTEVCEWRETLLDSGRLDPRAERVFGSANSKSTEHLNFLFQAFDTWVNVDIPGDFADLFVTDAAAIDSNDTSKVVLFSQQAGVGVDLFSACCRGYGTMRGRNRVFSLPDTIILYAVLLHRLHESADFPRQLRVIRNMIAASDNELRLEKMPALIADVERIVVTGTLDGVEAFNQAQLADERQKRELLTAHPEIERVLFKLEDNSLLRGSLAAFDLNAATLKQRASAFRRIFSDTRCWPAVTGAMLAVGDYSRQLNARFFQFGSSSNEAPWRALLTGAPRPQMERTRVVLGRLLDAVAQSDGELGECLEGVQAEWLRSVQEEMEFDWRYYFVKYPAMREGGSGIYVGLNGALGYAVCMLNKRQMNSWYRDPYLSAIWIASGVGDAVEDPWFTGYETNPRPMRLVKSGAELRCLEDGIAVRPPRSEDHGAAFSRVCQQHGVVEENKLVVAQNERDGRLVDTVDRVRVGAQLLHDLVNAGL
jgi:hypothetical protein